MQRHEQLSLFFKENHWKYLLPTILALCLAFFANSEMQMSTTEVVNFSSTLKSSDIVAMSSPNINLSFDNDSGSGSGGGGGGGTSSCNISSGGSISGNQINCGGYIPSRIISNRGANSCTTSGGQIGGSNSGGGSSGGSGSGGGGGVVGGTCGPVYQWQQSVNGGVWQNIGGADGSVYSPPFINQTTSYRRAARSACGTIWRFSNSITKTVDNAQNCNPTSTPCSVTSITRTVSNSVECRNGANFSIYLSGYYSIQGGEFVEYSDGTAKLSGSTSLGNVDITFYGRTEFGTPVFNCPSNPSTADWYYYSSFSGNIGNRYVEEADAHQFQVGSSANNQNVGYGASGWLRWGNVRGDISIRLSGNTNSLSALNNSSVQTISGTAFQDSNGDGIWAKNNLELGLPNIQVSLYECNNQNEGVPNLPYTLVSTTTTNSAGNYSFSSVCPGTYFVEFESGSFNYTLLNQGNDEDCDSDVNPNTGRTNCFTLTPNPPSISVGLIPNEPDLTITDITVNEDVGLATVQICASSVNASIIMVNYTTANGSATAGDDFTATTAKATIPAGQTCTDVSINIVNDNINEPNENFVINLTNPMGATIDDPQGQITIIDEDTTPAPSITINDVTVNESAGTAMLTICLSSISTSAVTVNYTTLNGSAQAGLDFSNVTGTITIPAGQLCMNVSIPIVDDNVQEPTETLFLSLTNPNGATIQDPLGQVTILDNDDPVQTPSITINDVTVNEDDGTATLQICIAAPSNSPVSVNYNTSNGSAQMNSDYSFASGLATIPAGQTCTNVFVPIIDDQNPESTENFVVNLTNPSGGNIADPQGQVTILDNDDAPTPSITINDVTVNEDDGTATTQLTLSSPATTPVTVNYSSSNGSAIVNSDYGFVSGTVTFPAGSTTATITSPILDDNIEEPTENYAINLANPNNATIADPQGQVTILDDDATTPSIIINDVTVNEDAGTATTQLTLSSPATTPVTVNYSSSNGSAIVNSDYGFVSGTVTFPAGSTTATITSPILDDNTPEPTENYAINLANPTNATIADPQGQVTILDDDNNNPNACEGLQISGANGQVVISGINSTNSKIEILGPGTGWGLQLVCDGNCGSTQTVPNLTPGEYKIKVQTFDPYCYAEYKVIVTSGGGGTPSISINNVTVNENAGTATLQLSLSSPSGSPVTVNYSSSNGSAIVNTDYGFVSGTVTFPTGSTSATVTIPILDDNIEEPTENFAIDLANPNGANIADSQGIVTILDNDGGGSNPNDCQGLSVSGANGQVTISGIKSSNTKIEIQGAGTGWALQLVCDGNCGTSQTVSGLTAGEYTIKVQTFNPYCYAEYKVNTNGGGGNTCPDGSPKKTPGTHCDDYNPNTDYDVIQADGCTCAGTDDGGGTPDCNNITANFEGNQVVIRGLTAPIVLLKVFDANWQLVYECNDHNQCSETIRVNANPNAGKCYIDIQFYTATWEGICTRRIEVGTDNKGGAGSRNAPQLEFTAFSVERQVELQWLTNTGWRNNYFELERSTDGETFEVIGKVMNDDLSDDLAYYQSLDVQPQIGINYYRIKQVYQDESYDYTTIEPIQFNIDLEGFSMYPNPAKEVLNLNLKPFANKSGTIRIVNNFGQIVKTVSIDKIGVETLNISLDNISNGFYQVMIQMEGQQLLTKKLIVERLY